MARLNKTDFDEYGELTVTEDVLEGVRLADEFKGKSLPACYAHYHTCGDIINAEEENFHRNRAVGLGYLYMVTATLKQYPKVWGVPDGSIYLEKFFPSLAHARVFANWHNFKTCGALGEYCIFLLKPRRSGGKRSPLEYGASIYIGSFTPNKSGHKRNYRGKYPGYADFEWDGQPWWGEQL